MVLLMKQIQVHYFCVLMVAAGVSLFEWTQKRSGMTLQQLKQNQNHYCRIGMHLNSGLCFKWDTVVFQ